MKNHTTKIIAIAALVFTILYMQCSSIPNDPLAGGTGAGNPGGSTTVSILLDSITPLGKIIAGPQPQSGPLDSAKRQFQISDVSGMPMTVTSAAIVVKAVNFILDSAEDPAMLLRQFNQPLQQDSADIAFPGPFVFDAITGRSNPSIDTLRLPETKYVGIKLILDTKNVGQPGGQKSVFEIGGLFQYKGETRSFVIRLRMGQVLPVAYKGSSIYVSRNDTTHLTISFNTSEWLNNVSIKTFLDNGQIALEPDGSLLIDGSAGSSGPSQSVEGTIRNNVISSCRLTVKQ